MIRSRFKNKEHLQAAVAITTKERLGFGAQRKTHYSLQAFLWETGTDPAALPRIVSQCYKDKSR